MKRRIAWFAGKMTPCQKCGQVPAFVRQNKKVLCKPCGHKQPNAVQQHYTIPDSLSAFNV